MISHIDPARSAITSILLALIGTLSKYYNTSVMSFGFITVDSALQRLAWSIAILAGTVAIVNGTKNWFKKLNKHEHEPD